MKQYSQGSPAQVKNAELDKPKNTSNQLINHKPGCGAVGHAGNCPVVPQDKIGLR